MGVLCTVEVDLVMEVKFEHFASYCYIPADVICAAGDSLFSTPIGHRFVVLSTTEHIPTNYPVFSATPLQYPTKD